MTPLIRYPQAETVIGAAIDVHRALGPGLLETAYDQCLAFELQSRGLRFEHQVAVPLVYKGVRIACSYRVDYVVEGQLLVELKAVERLMPIHDVQVLTYLRLLGLHKALLINFNVPRLVDGVKSIVNGPPPARFTRA